MRRRVLLVIVAGAIALHPRASSAQHKSMPVIGLINPLSPEPSPLMEAYLRSLREGLAEAGFTEGQNVVIEYHWAEGHLDRLPALMTDLVARKVDVIAATGGSSVAQAAKAATARIPIVFAAATDPVAVGLVASFAHPGGNLTGIAFLNTELMAKRFELLLDIAPEAQPIALLVHPSNPGVEQATREVQDAARAKGVQLHILRAATSTEIDAAFASCDQLHVKGLVVLNDPLFFDRREQVAALASHYAIAAIMSWREFVDSGGLISYGPSLKDITRQQGFYIGRILRGEKPADLPVQQPTKFELVINLKTAKALGLTVPQSLLQRVDEVIE
jgi:putative ABC transport system substrate-binding protein